MKWKWMNMKCEWDDIEYVNYMELNSRWKWCEWYMIWMEMNWNWIGNEKDMNVYIKV